MGSATLWGILGTFVGVVGLFLAWVVVFRPPAGAAPARPGHHRSNALRSFIQVPLLIVVGISVIATLVLITVAGTRSSQAPRPTVTVTVTATPNGGQPAQNSNEGDGAAWVAAFGALIAGVGTAASGTAAVIALRERKQRA